MSELDYNALIMDKQNTIRSCNSMINNLNEKITELEALKKKINSLDRSIQEAADRTIAKINGIPTLFSFASSVINLSFFSKITNVVKGSEFVKAHNDMKEAVSEIQKKISELNSQIEKNRSTIKTCNADISLLKKQQEMNM